MGGGQVKRKRAITETRLNYMGDRKFGEAVQIAEPFLAVA